MSRRGNLITLSFVLVLLVAAAVLAFVRPAVLGLDLQGGAEATIKAVPVAADRPVTDEDVKQSIEVLRRRVDALGVSEPEIRQDGRDRISIAVAGERNPERVFDLIGSTGDLQFIDLEGGLTKGVSRSVVSGGASISPKNSLRELLTALNAGSPKARTYYAFRKGAANPVVRQTASQADLRLIPAVAEVPAGQLEFIGVPQGKLAASCSSRSDSGCPGVNVSPEQAKTQPEKLYWYSFDLPAADQQLTGRHLDNARADFTPQGQPIVTMSFDGTGGRLFRDITKRLADAGRADYERALRSGQAQNGQQELFFHRFAVILDNDIKTYPTIDFTRNANGISGGNAEITGVSLGESKDIALVLQSGSLPVRFIPMATNQVSATLGQESLHQGLLAGIAGLVVVMIYMVVFYRFLGVIADIALLVYALLFYGLIVAIPVTMTLPGIAGMILTIGVAADANVVVFERIKEEVRVGKSVRTAIASGYGKGFRTILDANAVTLITAGVLFVASQATVKGFALLLALGVIVSMVTAVAATRAMLGLLTNFGWFQNAAFMGATAKPVRWKLDFAGRKTLWFAISGVVILIGLGSLATRGLNEGIDFKGGTRVTFTTGARDVTTADVRTTIGGISGSLRDSVIRGISTTGNETTRFREFQVDADEITPRQQNELRSTLLERYGSSSRIEDSRSVSASFGSEILYGAVLAFVFSIVLIVGYISFRFDWKYAVPMIAALLHDVLITVGVYSLTGREVTSSTVAAVLTILGYSLYDTIIVFDRVRENEAHLRRHTYDQIVNISLWETITRSLNTSLITLLPILTLFLFGGSTLRDFAFALLVGIFSGAYSSFFIATPLLSLFKGREPEYARRAGSAELPAVFRREGLLPGVREPAPAGPPAPRATRTGAVAGGAVATAEPVTADPVTAAGDVPTEDGDVDDQRAAIEAARLRRQQRRAGRRPHGRPG